MSLTPITPRGLAPARGFTHGFVAPAGARLLFVAGQVASDAAGAVEAVGLAEQFARALDNVLAVVREADGDPGDVARMTVYVTDMEAYRAATGELTEVWRARMGRHYPAMALVEVRSLVDPNALVEIEATAALG